MIMVLGQAQSAISSAGLPSIDRRDVADPGSLRRDRRGPNNENAQTDTARVVAVIQGAPTTAALSVIQGAQTQPDIDT